MLYQAWIGCSECVLCTFPYMFRFLRNCIKYYIGLKKMYVNLYVLRGRI